jgi:hypothetical protein
VVSLYVLLGICGDLAPGLHSEIDDISEELRDRLRRGGMEVLRRCNGTIVLLCCVLEQNSRDEVLPDLRRYAEVAAASLSELSASTVNEKFTTAEVLLHQLGFGTGRKPETTPLAPDLFEMITGSRTRVEEVVLEIEGRTRFGQRGIDASDGLAPVLEAVLMEALKRYDLEFACRLLRSLGYLSETVSPAMRMARDFLLMNQDVSGCFGFFDAEIRQLEADIQEEHAGLKVLLPTAVACLWALGEAACSDYRMLRDLGRKHPQGDALQAHPSE